MKSFSVNRRNIFGFVNGLAESHRRMSEDAMQLDLVRLDAHRLSAIISIVPASQYQDEEEPLFRDFLDITAAHLLGAPGAPHGFTSPIERRDNTMLTGHMLLVRLAVEVVKSRQRVMERLPSFNDTPLTPSAFTEDDRTPVPS